MKTENFSIKSLKTYLETYKQGGLENKSSFLDALYGLGLAVDKERYKFGDGFDIFKMELIKELERSLWATYHK